MDASGVIAYYVMDGNRPLTAESNGNTTTYLYGLGVIGEENTTWSYSLTDGTNTQRQLTDSTGEVTYSARYTPWGDTLDSSGTGNFTFGYFGGLMDEATGLLYVGEGQYYDPQTGRFLTRGVNSNSTNPYLPFDPTGALFVPLGLLGLIYGKKKHKNKLDYVVIIVFISLGVGLGLTACGDITAEDIGITPTSTPMPLSATVIQTQTAIHAVISTPTQLVTVTAPAPSSTPVYNCPVHIYDREENEEYKRRIRDEFGIILGGSRYGTEEWASVRIQIVYHALTRINDALGGNLKSRLGVEAVFHHITSKTGEYGGYTRSTNSIEFTLADSFPYHLIYHEMGHLLNNAQGRKYTYSLDHKAVYTGTGKFVMGRDCPAAGECNNSYTRIDGEGLINLFLQDPCGENVPAELHSIALFPIDGNTAIEEWGDLFANYVVGNFNTNDAVGSAKYNWVRDQLFGG
jgi:RHS repeat-associated protein